ncbi:prepilin-type N-terminal cleavage/methylation domain-containing protein [Azohydromonas caseinilytica]|uniref:Prepilin-type N-terminal cleavage/methylation domain-containing protein n=1 Tax=Azohydromonas caseinilytica TaxID=2728836 RepID=A0A848F082_9BURK|nr:prepilin-type N-terminal cleavage/methylation domain-containing protein [Azohydromonas caseinilytica]NML13467.1 prepilin-type N-terminal cleavage/methylation domain-containing protein [Azohydromonas caseinilytica]
MNRQRGFTIIELMVVIAIIAIAAGVSSLALRDADAKTLDQEASRLSALLESARAQARAAGLPVRFELASQGSTDGDAFRFVGLPPAVKMPTRWLDERTSAEIVGARALRLGPEPLIGAQRIVLRLQQRSLVLATDGLGPFAMVESGKP